MPNYPSLYGWDTVFAITLAKFNRALALHPHSDTYTFGVPISNGQSTFKWQFGTWQATDVTGDRLKMHLPFVAGSELVFTPSAAGSQPTTTPILEADYLCEVTITPVWTTEANSRLVAATTNSGDWANVTVTPRHNGDFDTGLILQTILTKWFDVAVEAQTLFLREMAVIDMNDDIQKYKLPWLKPNALGFAGGTMADGATKAVGFFALTDRAPPLSQPSTAATKAQLSPYAIPANTDAAFLISRELFLRNLILPALAGTYSEDGTGKLSSFELSGSYNEKLTNVAELTFTTDLNGVSRKTTIAINGLSLVLEGERLSVSIKNMDIETGHLGITAVVTVNESLAVSMVAKGDTPGDLIFLLTNKSASAPDIQIGRTQGAVIGESVATALLLAAGIALAIVSFRGPLRNIEGISEKTAKILARVIAGVVALGGAAATFVPMVIAAMANGDVKKIPDFTPLLDTSLGRFAWPGSDKTRFVARDAMFSDCLMVTVDPVDPKPVT
jgi:hypothetical protein